MVLLHPRDLITGESHYGNVEPSNKLFRHPYVNLGQNVKAPRLSFKETNQPVYVNLVPTDAPPRLSSEQTNKPAYVNQNILRLPSGSLYYNIPYPMMQPPKPIYENVSSNYPEVNQHPRTHLTHNSGNIYENLQPKNNYASWTKDRNVWAQSHKNNLKSLDVFNNDTINRMLSGETNAAMKNSHES